jgi:hypothetical protein
VHSYIRAAPFSASIGQKPKEKLFLLRSWHVLQVKKRPYARMLQQMQPGFIILKCRQKGNLWNDTIFYLPRRKNSKTLHL